MTAIYQKHGLHFLYPENWRLDETTDLSLPCSISLEAPDGNAFWALHLHPQNSDGREIIQGVVATLSETYSDLEVSECSGDFDTMLATEKSTAVEAMFFCLDFLIRVRLQIIPLDGHQGLLWFQAEDRVFDKMEMVFRAIGTSLLTPKPSKT